MAGLTFDKQELGNLEYSLNCEILSTNRSGGYMSTTILCCNTRKYHGLMVTPIEGLDPQKNYVLLSSLDESLIQNDQTFNLAIHCYPGIYEPRGHKYITDFEYTPTPSITYRVGGAVLKKEMLWIYDKSQLMIRYTLLEASKETVLRLRPMLAFRETHTVASANMDADGRVDTVVSGVKCRLYPSFPYLNMQIDSDNEFVRAPDWYYRFEYPQERERGYPYTEDLLTPGFFELPLQKGRSVIFSCSFSEEDPSEFGTLFENELGKRLERTDFLSCLRRSARQFLITRGSRSEVIAGYPWFGAWGRDTFISLPGLTLTQGLEDRCIDAIDTMLRDMKGGLFPNVGTAYNSVDAPLWFFWTLQQLERKVGKRIVWDRYGEVMKQVIEYFSSVSGPIEMRDNGLLWVDAPGQALTWMDAVIDGVAVTPRNGHQIEINALWYNAVCYTAELDSSCGNGKFAEKLRVIKQRISESFMDVFWYGAGEYLADHVDETGQDISIRPNQVIACSLNYRIPTNDQAIAILRKVRQHLLTPKGLRTLTPKSPLYEGRYGGSQPERDRQYHQGTVWPWLLEHYVQANYLIYGNSFTPTAASILSNFEEDISSYGIGSVPEIYDGDPPHEQKGAPWQAWSVAALLSIDKMIEDYSD